MLRAQARLRFNGATQRNGVDMSSRETKQLLHFVFGGELESTTEIDFKDLTKLDFVGMYPNFAQARKAWLAKSQASVDNAQMRYFMVHMHRLMEPDADHDH
jgi:hypothetical protein